VSGTQVGTLMSSEAGIVSNGMNITASFGRQADAIMMDAQHSAAVLWTDSRFGGEY
jgi:hypothetical protein